MCTSHSTGRLGICPPPGHSGPRQETLSAGRVTLSVVLAALLTSADRAPPSHLQDPMAPSRPRTTRLPSRLRVHLGSCGLAHTWEPTPWLSHTQIPPQFLSLVLTEPNSGPAPPYSADLLPENLKEYELHSMTSSCLKPDVSLKMLCGLASNGRG